MIEFIVDSCIHTDQLLPREVFLALRKALSFPNPDYVNRKIFGRSIWNVPREICLLDQKTGRTSIPRGAIGLLREIIRGYDSKFINNMDSLQPLQLSYNLELRDYQELAVTELVNSVQGCLIAPCGAGKTVMGTAAIARINQPALVLVHTTDLLDQWVEAIEKSLSPVKPGVIAGGKNDQQPVTVAMVQSLAKTALRAFGTVILDECAHCPAITFRNVLDRLPGKYRFGLTATPDRADGLGKLLELCIGPIAHRIEHQQLVDAGHLVVPDVFPIDTRFTPQGDTYNEIIADMIASDDRNDVILGWIYTAVESKGRATLVLSNRVDHCHELANLFVGEDFRAAALTSRVPKKKRKTILDDFKSGKLEIVCATSLADEGLDISRLECLILATPAKAEGRTIQRLGRLMRPHPGKRKPVLYDLVDNHPIAWKQFMARRRAYRKILNKEIEYDIRQI